jgi:hypothetical protein
MSQKKEKESPSFYQLVIVPQEDGLHKLTLMEHYRPSDADKHEHHTTENLINRIRELDLDGLRARQAEEDRNKQRVAYHRSFPPKWL